MFTLIDQSEEIILLIIYRLDYASILQLCLASKRFYLCIKSAWNRLLIMRYPHLPSQKDDWCLIHKYLDLYEPKPSANRLFQMYENKISLFFESNRDKIIFSTNSDEIIAGTIVAYLICTTAPRCNSNLTYRLTIARPGGVIEGESGMLQLLQTIQSSYGHHGSTIFKHENSLDNPIIVTIVCESFLTQVRHVCSHAGVKYKLNVRLSTKWIQDFSKRAYGISYT